MPRPEDSQWAVSVAQVASRPGQSKPIDTVFPRPAASVTTSSASGRVPMYVWSARSTRLWTDWCSPGRIEAPLTAECTRCLKPIDPTGPCTATLFFPYDAPGADDGRGTGEVEIIAGEDEARGRLPAEFGRRVRRHGIAAARHAGGGAAVAAAVQGGLPRTVPAVAAWISTRIPTTTMTSPISGLAALEQFKARLEAEEHRD